MTAAEFKTALESIFMEGQRQGHGFVDVSAGQLHRQVGGYPGPDHRMPVCCGVMTATMRSNDQVLEEPPKGKGASLTIRYYLPR